MGFKRFFLGEKVPDKNDPDYKELHEQSVEAGRKFAETLHLGKAAACVQRFATNHSKLFLVIIFSFLIFSFTLSLYRMSQATSHRSRSSTAVEQQEKQLHFNRHHRMDDDVELNNRSITPQSSIDYEDNRKN